MGKDDRNELGKQVFECYFESPLILLSARKFTVTLYSDLYYLAFVHSNMVVTQKQWKVIVEYVEKNQARV